MRFPDPLIRGRLIKRYKRFLSDVELADGGAVTAHCANPGSMMGLDTPGLEAWLSPARNPARKLRYTLEMVGADNSLVGVNTQHPNGLVAEALAQGGIPELAGYGSVRREVPYGRNSRIDLLLEETGRPPCYVEVKNVHLKRESGAGGAAEFPDSVTQRGAKHLAEMADVVAQGGRAVMLYVVQRQDCGSFRVAADIDPAYNEALGTALAAGVEAICYACRLSPEGIDLADPLPLAQAGTSEDEIGSELTMRGAAR